jgi:hypothetical protein
MRVAVDEAGDHKPAFGVDALVIAVLVRQRRCRSDPDDVGSAPGKRGVWDWVNRLLPPFITTGRQEADIRQDWNWAVNS